MKYDVVIIGAGLGGLECAHLLARSGRSVLLLEQSAHIGGCIQSYTRRGMDFDTGFHYVGGLGEGQLLHAVFEHLGLLRLPWQRLDKAFDRIKIGECDYVFMQGYDNFVEALATDFPTERAALKRLVGLMKESSTQPFSLLNPQIRTPPTFDLYGTNTWQYLQENFHDPMLLNVLGATSLKMELRKETLPLFTFIHGNSNFIESSWRLKGGGSLIADSLANDIREMGGKIVCQAGVKELVEKEGKLVAAICENGETYEGDLFISDIHPAQTCNLLKQSEKMRSAYRNRIARLKNTFGMFTVSLRLKPRAIRYFNWNHFVYRKPNVWTFYREGNPVGGVMISCRVPEDGSEYASQIDLLTPMTWNRCQAWSQTKIGHRGEDYLAMKEQVADECIMLAERCLPGLGDAYERRYISTPLTYRDYTRTPDGSAYGIRKDAENPMMTMLSVRTPVPNLLLTGQNLMLHGVCGVTMTALFTCAEVMGKEAVWKILNGH